MIELMSILAIVNLLVGLFAGAYYERLQWNQLIQEGKIPAPKRG